MTRSYPELQGRVALVTGASSGIGRATAVSLAANGVTVGVHYHTGRAGAEETLRQVEAAGGHGLLLAADLADLEQARELVPQLLAATGRLDVLINNAGSPLGRVPLAECPLALWQQVLTLNLTAHFVVTQAAIPALRHSGHGVIINNLSLAVQTGGANGAGPYGAAKGGLQVLTRTLARELAPEVRCNAIMPGVIETPHHEVFTTPQRLAEYRAETPLRRNGQAAEVAGAILFLVSDAASFITGALLDINGGRFLR